MNAPAKLTRPALRWYGGKWRLAPWIISHFPAHRTYVEPFGGAGSVLLRKSRAYAEVYNDLDEEVVTLFRVLRDPALSAQLIENLELTPFARAEFEGCYQPTEDPVEVARHLLVRSYMGFGSNAHSSPERGHRSTGFRSNSNRSGTTPAQDWRNYPGCLPAIIDRLRGVIVERRPAKDVMTQHDGPATLHYVDPPYLPETRSPANKYDQKYRMYRHELDRAGHAELLAALQGLTGMVVLSGYPDPLYDETLSAWLRVETKAFADGARVRTEVLWINPAAAEALQGRQGPLFDGAAI